MATVKKLSISDLRAGANKSDEGHRVELKLSPINNPKPEIATKENENKADDNNFIANEKKEASAEDKPKKKSAFKRTEDHVIQSFADMKKNMATMKMLAPLIGTASSIAENPESIAKTTRALVDDAYKFADQLCDFAGIDPMDAQTQWLRSQAVEVAAWQVSSHAKRNMAGIDGSLDDLIKSAKAISELPSLEYPQFPNTNIPLSIRLKMTAMKSVMGLTRELSSAECVLAGKDMIEGFSFNKKEIIEHAAKVMFNAVADVVTTTDIRVGHEESKMTLFQGMMNHASTLYNSAAIFQIDRMIDEVEMAPMSKKKDAAILNLEEIDKKFHSDFGALVAISIDAQDNYIAAFSESSQINPTSSRPSKRKRFSVSDI